MPTKLITHDDHFFFLRVRHTPPKRLLIVCPAQVFIDQLIIDEFINAVAGDVARKKDINDL